MTSDARTAATFPAVAPRRADSLLAAFTTLVFFTLLAGDFWRNLIGWAGWGALIVLLTGGTVAWLVVRRPRLTPSRIPRMLVAFLAFAIASIAWSAYPGVSAIAAVAQLATTAAGALLALCFDWRGVLRVLGNTLRWIIGLSLAFELIVAVFVRHPVLPLWVDYGSGKLPKAFYWSRDLLLNGGQIQGILGNSNLLAMCALLALIVFAVQLRDRTVRRGAGITWLVLAVAVFLLARSSTVIIAAVATVVVLVFALWARRIGESGRWPVYVTGVALVAVAVAGMIGFWGRFVEIFGKSEDLTGRLTIWAHVIELAGQRPVVGWGWTSYWAPWVEPFKHLAVRGGVEYLQAHDAWLDLWLQLGIVGLVIFALLVATTARRAWFVAVDPVRTGVGRALPFTATALLPVLIMAALIAQSVAESRMLIEGGWALLVLVCLKTKSQEGVAPLDAPRAARPIAGDTGHLAAGG